MTPQMPLVRLIWAAERLEDLALGSSLRSAGRHLVGRGAAVSTVKQVPSVGPQLRDRVFRDQDAPPFRVHHEG